MKIQTRTKDCQLVVRVKTAIGERIDAEELRRFADVYLRGFLKPRQLKMRLIEYTGPVGISLYERLRRPIRKRDFLFLVEQIVSAVQRLQANQMKLNHVILNLQNVYINEATKEVQFLYVPFRVARRDTGITEFVESVVYSVKPADDNDSDFASRFICFFRGLRGFDPEKVESFIAKEDRSVVSAIKKQMTGSSGFMTDKPKHYYEHYEQSKAEREEAAGLSPAQEDEEATGLLRDDVATGLLSEHGDDEATGLLNQGSDETMGLWSATDEEGTALLNENKVSVHYPTLFRILTEENISVNKPVYRLGKERSYVDYFVTNNIAVSRSHADIITRGTRYFVMDLNSKNHTFLNGQEIPVQYEVELHDGDRLKLANEEFIFNV